MIYVNFKCSLKADHIFPNYQHLVRRWVIILFRNTSAFEVLRIKLDTGTPTPEGSYAIVG